MTTSFRLLAAAILVVSLALPANVTAQGAPRVSGVDPASGKTGDTVTVNGENLDKGTVSAVYFSDSSSDHKAIIVHQSGEKILVKVPQVKPGGYNISIQIKNDILIQPIRFTVEG